MSHGCGDMVTHAMSNSIFSVVGNAVSRKLLILNQPYLSTTLLLIQFCVIIVLTKMNGGHFDRVHHVMFTQHATIIRRSNRV